METSSFQPLLQSSLLIPICSCGYADIDECKDEKSNNCLKGNCINIPGSYQCKCPDSYYGEGWNNGTGCIADVIGFPVLKFTLGNIY